MLNSLFSLMKVPLIVVQPTVDKSGQFVAGKQLARLSCVVADGRYCSQ